ncbi:MAG: tetratricopeptide repeat protein, partial [Bryobacteraceae bacterium]
MPGIGGVRRLQFCFDLLLAFWCTSALLADVQPNWSDQKRQAIASVQARDLSKAENLLNAALAALPSAETSEAVLLWNQLGLIYEVDNLRLTEAKQAFRHALDINEHKEKRSDIEEAIGLNNLGTAFQLADDLKTAEKLFRQADSVLTQCDLLQTSTTGPVLSNLALVLQEQGRFAESEITYEHAVAAFHRSNTEGTLEFARCVTNFGRLKYETGHFQEALTQQERALSLEVALPSNALNAGDRAYVLCNLGMARGQLGMLSAARESLLEAIDLETSNQAAPDPRLPETLNDLATIENNMDKLSLAKEHGQQALAFADRLRSKDDPIRAAIWTNLGTMATKEHDYKYARQLYDEAAGLWLKALGPNRPEYGATLFNIANLEAREGHRKQAKTIFLRCLQIDLSWFGPRHPQV